ncbi:MAG: RNA polymerase sigma factor [Gaiellaceae bacterium]|jgi:RNA polymerase sigma-70 factor (ECF subfamily)
MNVTGRLQRSKSDEQPFERLYEQHFERVAAYLLARTDRDSAAEAVARTFEIAWRRLPDMPVEPLPWLLGVARRVLADQRRAQGRRNALIEHIAETAMETFDDHAEALATRELVLAAIKDLTLFQQEALLLIAWDGLSEREVAAVLGCSRGAVALRLHRARKQLRAALDRTAPESSLVGDASGTAAPRRPVHPCTKETT